MLVANALSKAFGERKVVDGVDLRVDRAEIVGLLGPNGAGKTTIFGMIVGEVKADEGTIFIGEKEITRFTMAQRARCGVSYLAQERSIFRKLSVADNLRLILEMRDCSRVHADEVFRRVVDRFDLQAILAQRTNQLSGGQQRRVEVARALMNEPELILLDEPFSGIDPIAVAELQRVINDLRRDGYGILITDHNVRETLAITDRSYIIYAGQIIAHGTPSELVENPDARRFFFGEDFRFVV